MNRHERLLQTILRGRSDANVRFADLRALMQHLGFEERSTRKPSPLSDKEGVLQKRSTSSADDGNAKPYQVRQVRRS